MAQGKIEAEIPSLQTQNPSIKFYTPESSDYETLKKTYIISPAKPAAIARPQTAEDVQALVRVCVDRGLDFNIRTGGHNCVGRALVEGALLIDMRDIADVSISEDKKTAKIGGGILAGGLLKALGEHGLITPWFDTTPHTQTKTARVLASSTDFYHVVDPRNRWDTSDGAPPVVMALSPAFTA